MYSPNENHAVVDQMIATVGIEDGEVVLASRAMHHNNLDLRLIHDARMDYWRIDVLRRNDRSTHDMWGIFTTASMARDKFQSIKL